MKPKYLRVGPNHIGQPAIEFELRNGESCFVVLDRAHARSVAERLVECVDGRIAARPPSRRILEVELVDADTLPAPSEKSA